MKAILYKEYGPPDVLKIEEVEKPTPKNNEVLIKIFSTSVNYGDIILRNFRKITPKKFNMPFFFWLPTKIILGIRKPKRTILGSEFAGEIESIGKNVKLFKKGDQVFGYLSMNMGANAEHVCMPEKGLLAIKPNNMTHEEAAAVPYGALTALSLLRKVNIQPGQKVLINGASGSIGSWAVQLAKYFGAKVTGVCGTPRLEYVKSLGVDKVIDYSKEDFTKNSETYDLIFDILGKSSLTQCKNSLKKNGRLLFVSFKMKKMIQMLWTKIIGSKKVICALSSYKTEDILFIKGLIEAGKVKSVIDKCFPMEQAAEAHRYVESGNKKGNVIITLSHNNET